MSHKLRQWASRARRLIGNILYSSAFATVTMIGQCIAALIMVPVVIGRVAVRLWKRRRVIKEWRRIRAQSDMPKRRP